MTAVWIDCPPVSRRLSEQISQSNALDGSANALVTHWSEAALRAYKAHPTYAEATQQVRPSRDERFAADIQAPEDAVAIKRAV